MNNVKAIQKINEAELRLGLDSKKSWHDMYSSSAYIFIGGLNYDLSEGDILAVFSQYGEILNINLVRDKHTGKPKGFCFLCYENQKSTILAVDNLNGIKLCGRTIRVDHVTEYRRPKDEDGNEIIEKGCAPHTPTPSPEPSDSESEVVVTKSKKKKTKKHKDKKKKKTKHLERTEPESHSDSDPPASGREPVDSRTQTNKYSRERYEDDRRDDHMYRPSKPKSVNDSRRDRDDKVTGYRSRSGRERDYGSRYRERSRSRERRDERRDKYN